MGVTSFTTACSQRYIAALQGPITRVASLAQVWSGTTLLATFLPEPGLLVTVDRNNALRRTVAGSVAGGVNADGTNVVPASAKDIFTPVGNEIRLWRGMQYLDGTGDIELLPEGVFGIEDVDVVESGADLVVQFTGSDRAQAVSRDKATDQYVIPPNTNGATAIQNLISSRLLGFAPQFNFAAIPFSTPPTPIVYPDGDDLWADALLLAAAFGCELYPDPSGVYTLQPIPDPTQQPVWMNYLLDPPSPTSSAVALTRHLSRKLACNCIIRIGQGSGIPVPVRAISQDLNPASATYVYGPYGQQVDRQTSPLLLTQAQAQTASDAQLLLSLGSLETLDADVFCRPDADVDKVIAVTRTRAGIVSEQYVLDAFTVPFTQGEKMAITGARALTSFISGGGS